MYLKKIKISGFKSFVESTELHFPHDMTAVVGPNGCGKSNIIDAVRWVLGESSAKHLRGDAMADVIFNGSVSRAAVSRASVELIFDNAQQRIDHALLQYNEVSIRRELYRDGTNQYYLNGKKCRRKDVTELFLGTGLGPRSYAIIEQGMISRLIESKPVELRNFIEEAAGISKYKEKRRETELRIKQTKDNLNRLADIRAELGSQIDKLKVQSAVALQFRQLKQQQRETKSRLSLVQIYDVERAVNQLEKQRLALVTEQQKFTTSGTKLDTQMTVIDMQLQALNIQIDSLQQDFYLHGTELTKLEQQILHHQARNHESAGKQRQYQQQHSQLQQLLSDEKQQLNELQQRLELTEAEHNQLQTQLHTLELSLIQANISSAETASQHAAYVEQQQMLNAELTLLTGSQKSAQALLAKTQSQHGELTTELQQLMSQSMQAVINDKSQQLVSSQEYKRQIATQVSQLEPQLASVATQMSEAEQQLSQSLDAQRELTTSQQVLTELLRQSQDNELAHHWLESNFNTIPLTLLQQLNVEPGWEPAVEKVLANWLDAYCINSNDLASFNLNELPALQWVTSSQCPVRTGSLAEKVTGNLFNRLLNQVCCVATSAAALQASQADGRYSYITPEGDWLSDEGNWLATASHGSIAPQGRIAMQQQLQQLQIQLAAIAQRVTEQQARLALLQDDYQQCQALLQDAKTANQQAQQRLEQLNLELDLLQQQQRQWQHSVDQLQTRLSGLDLLISSEHAEVMSYASKIAIAELQLNEQVNSDALLQKAALAQQAQADKDNYLAHQQQLAGQAQSLLLTQTKLTVEIEKQQQVIGKTEQQFQQIIESIAGLGDSKLHEEKLQQLQAELAILVEKQLAADRNNLKNKSQRTKLTDDKRELAQKHARIIASGLKVSDKIQLLDIKQANNKAKEQLLYQQIREDNVDIAKLKRDCVNILTQKEYQYTLQQLDSQLQQMGAVNLAAVEEFEQQSQRKLYLDEQTDDLDKAIATLEAAIIKIDKQTRARFATTFDNINNDFKALFPKVFGGGAAWLELTSSNLLDAGVAIMARPPGKNNARISLLSGGEKALTALSLVFAIFRLNPAPFCMLDEVDAPLDELNVGRFCKLVQEMSETVQFIYISHNKLAMEMAQQLIGVTMHEPGVSRIVAVDISTAIELTDN